MQVSLIGEQSDFVCSGSDGGFIFIWNAKTGQLVNVIRANETVTTCVAPHPHVPMLASCGFEPAVRLWSPEVGPFEVVWTFSVGLVFVCHECQKCSNSMFDTISECSYVGGLRAGGYSKPWDGLTGFQ